MLHAEVTGERRKRQQAHHEADVDAIENEDEQLQTAWNHAHDLEPWLTFILVCYSFCVFFGLMELKTQCQLCCSEFFVLCLDSETEIIHQSIHIICRIGFIFL